MKVECRGQVVSHAIIIRALPTPIKGEESSLASGFILGFEPEALSQFSLTRGNESQGRIGDLQRQKGNVVINRTKDLSLMISILLIAITSSLFLIHDV